MVTMQLAYAVILRGGARLSSNHPNKPRVPGHYTLWGDPAVLFWYVLAVQPVARVD
jgi:hypothetical protein